MKKDKGEKRMNTTLIIMAAGIGSQIWRRNQAVSPDGSKWRNHHGLFHS